MKKILNYSRIMNTAAAFFIGLLFISGYSFAQEISGLSQTIRGQVVDKETQTTFPGATIQILNTDPLIGSVEDIDGNFRIENVPVGRVDIQVSFVEYKPNIISEMQVTVSKEIVLKIQLQEDKIEFTSLTIVVPEISYKIEFLPKLCNRFRV